MTHPESSHQPDKPDPRARVVPPAVNTGPGDRPPVDRAVNPETAYGGADAVEKTSYVVGRGTEPTAQAHGEPGAHPRGGAGPNYLAWGIGALAVLIAIIYLFRLIV